MNIIAEKAEIVTQYRERIDTLLSGFEKLDQKDGPEDFDQLRERVLKVQDDFLPDLEAGNIPTDQTKKMFSILL